MRTECTGIKWLWLLVCICACSDKYQSLVDAAPSPHLYFDRDTIVVREKDALYVARVLNPFVRVFAKPSPPQMHIQYNDSSGKVRFSYRGVQLIEGNPLIVAGDSTLLFCHCDEAGLFAVDFHLTDHLGKTDSRVLMVNCVGNDRPKASLAVSLIDSSIAGNWQYRFDGSTSVKKYGLITGYSFSVDGQALYNLTPAIDYTFHVNGSHTVQLFVTDDLGVHSDTITQKIHIP